MKARAIGVLLLAVALLGGCAGLGALRQVVQAPRFDVSDTNDAQLRLLGPSLRHPVGGLQIRLYARVSNPNPIGLTLARLAGTLALEGNRAADVNFPLGLPLPAGGETEIPLDIEVGFANLPRLAELVPNALSRGSLGYSLNGTVSVDAGVLGQPSFGPMNLLQGTVRTQR